MALNHRISLFKLIVENKSLPNFISVALFSSSVKNYTTSNIDELRTLNQSKFQKVIFFI